MAKRSKLVKMAAVGEKAYRLVHYRRLAPILELLDEMDRSDMRDALVELLFCAQGLRKELESRGITVEIPRVNPAVVRMIERNLAACAGTGAGAS